MDEGHTSRVGRLPRPLQGRRRSRPQTYAEGDDGEGRSMSRTCDRLRSPGEGPRQARAMTAGDHVTIRMDSVLIVVEDIEAAKAFFTELGMEVEGETQVEGAWADSTVGLKDVRADITMMRTPDGHSRVELSRFHTPPAVRAATQPPPPTAGGGARGGRGGGGCCGGPPRRGRRGGGGSARGRPRGAPVASWRRSAPPPAPPPACAATVANSSARLRSTRT